MWKLYLLLKPAIDKQDTDDTLLDLAEKVLDVSPQGTLVASLDILYDNIPSTLSGMDVILMFAEGVTKNDFYEFVDFIKVLA